MTGSGCILHEPRVSDTDSHGFPDPRSDADASTQAEKHLAGRRRVAFSDPDCRQPEEDKAQRRYRQDPSFEQKRLRENFISLPDYAATSASFSKRYGIGAVLSATNARRGIMVLRSYRRLNRYSNSARYRGTCFSRTAR